MSKDRARSGFRSLQKITGIALLLSTLAGVYLLATDGSLWLLAVSHAVGLVIIVLIDGVLGILNLSSRKRVYLPTLAAACLALVLQLGDLATAPQYGMTIAYFASYLFHLWAFDLLLALQVLVLTIGVVGRPYTTYLARRKSRRGRELDFSRRTFVGSILGFTALIGLGVLIGSVKLPAPSQSQTTSTQTQSGLPKSAIANTNNLQVGTPLYFDYPSGYPNILMKNSDGSLTALSLICTHVCCQCSYVASSKVIYCPCHGSVFDLAGNVMRGPAGSPLPTIRLQVDGSGNVFPVGVSNPGPCGI
jgi:cytochrome b6-f complex iron-sulfur subunit